MTYKTLLKDFIFLKKNQKYNRRAKDKDIGDRRGHIHCLKEDHKLLKHTRRILDNFSVFNIGNVTYNTRRIRQEFLSYIDGDYYDS